jgi:hypothetical protein
MVKQDQKYRLKAKIIFNPSGQAAVEYILLLVITVSLVIGATKAFRNMNDFMNRYIGEYVVCLMEYGELPSLGTTEANLKKHLGGGSGRKCDQEFSGFTFEGGRSPLGGGGGSGGSSASGSASSAKNNNSNSKNSSANASKDGSEKGGGKDASDSAGNADGSDRGGGSGRKAAPYAQGKIIRASTNNYGTADAGGGDQKTKVIDEEEGGNGRKKDSNNYSSTTRVGKANDRYRAITGTMAKEIEKRQPKKANPVRRSVRALAGDEGNRFTPYKKVLPPREYKEKESKDDDNSSFGFGYIIRWLIIAGMVLAIIVFFGGQVMNYSNSKD